jgi:hypothetical protein
MSDLPELPETEEEPQEKQHPFTAVYPCKYGCGFQGTPQQLSAHYRTVHRHERAEFQPSQGVGGPLPGEAPIPDAMESLRNLLQLFIGPKDSLGLIEYLKPYGPDNLFKLYEGLSNLGVALNKRKMIVEAWSVSRGLNIPESLRRELGIQPMPTSSMPSGYGPYSPYGSSYGFMEQPQKREDLDLFDRLIKWESLKMQSQQQTIAQPNLENQYQQQIETLRLELQKAQENYRAEVEKLKEELRRKEQERLEERLRSLEERLRSYERPSGDYRDDEMRLFAEAIKEIGRKNPMQQVLDFLSKHPELIAMAQGQIPTERIAPPQTRQGLIQILKERGLVVPT